ncbi:hypothetical protein CLOM_g9426 [Closterium sp. NIES-68]|nr:hypothetical protein CLOM_g9426 [Closterium sp. NIES-68]
MFRAATRAATKATASAAATTAAASATGVGLSTAFAEPAVQSDGSVPFGFNGSLRPLDGSWEEIPKPASPTLPAFPQPADSASAFVAGAARAGRQRGSARVISLAPPSREETDAAWAEVVSTMMPPPRPSHSSAVTGGAATRASIAAGAASAAASRAGEEESMAESTWESGWGSEWGSERASAWDSMGDDAAASMAASERALQVARASSADAAWQQIAGGALAVTGRMQQRGGVVQQQQYQQQIQQYQQNPIAMLLAQVEADREAVATVRSLASSPGVFMAIMNDPVMQEFIRSRGGVHMPGVNRITEVTEDAGLEQQQQQSASAVPNGNARGGINAGGGGPLWEYLSFALGKMRSVVDAISDLLGTAFLPASLSSTSAAGSAGPDAAAAAAGGGGSATGAAGGSSASGLAGLMTVVVSLVVVVVLVVIKNRANQ